PGMDNPKLHDGITSADVPQSFLDSTPSQNRDSFEGESRLGEPVQLTDQQWNAMSREQQQGVIANYALYEAGLADAELDTDLDTALQEDPTYLDRVNALFGEGGGSDSYAPNTVRLLEE